MTALACVPLDMADDIGAVTEALIELHRHTLAGRSGPSTKFAKLAALHASRRGEMASTIVRLAPSTADVLDLATEVLSDLEVYIRTAPQ